MVSFTAASDYWTCAKRKRCTGDIPALRLQASISDVVPLAAGEKVVFETASLRRGRLLSAAIAPETRRNPEPWRLPAFGWIKVRLPTLAGAPNMGRHLRAMCARL